jgi:hypothetical protein
VSPYGSDAVTLEPSEDNNSEGMTAYQLMMRPRSRPTTARTPVSTDSPTAVRTTPPRVPRIVRATQPTPATPATPRTSVHSTATVDLSYSNPTFETNSAFSPRLGLVRHLSTHPCPPRTHVLCVGISLSVDVAHRQRVQSACFVPVQAAASPRSNVTLATRAGWSRVGLTGSAAEEFDATCRNAKDPDPLLHIENLEGEVRHLLPPRPGCCNSPPVCGMSSLRD